MITLEQQIRIAAQNLEALLNMLPKQFDAKITKTRTLEDEYRLAITITSTHPVQIYP